MSAEAALRAAGQNLVVRIREFTGRSAENKDLDAAVADMIHALEMTPGDKPRFSHAFDFACEVQTEKEDPSQVTGAEIRTSLLERIEQLDDAGILNATDCFDSSENDVVP